MAQDTAERRYNGWTNYETWGVALVLDNDHGTYSHIRECIDTIREEAPESRQVEQGIWTVEEAVRFEAADFLKDFTETLCGTGSESEDLGIPEPSMMAQQLLGAALSEVDWDEIANHVLSE